MIPHFSSEPGQTLLTHEEQRDLIPDDVSTHGALNEVEAENIVDGEQ